MTQEEVADEVGVDKTAVSHWENAVARPDVMHLSKLASIFETTIAELVAGEDGVYGVLSAALEAKAS